jgi:hypothetical protein
MIAALLNLRRDILTGQIHVPMPGRSAFAEDLVKTELNQLFTLLGAQMRLTGHARHIAGLL